MAKAARKTVSRRKRGPGRPKGFKCSAATRAKMRKSALARWRGHKGKAKKTTRRTVARRPAKKARRR